MNFQKQRFNYPNGPLPDGFILKYFSFRALQVGNRNGSAVYPAKLTSILVAKVKSDRPFPHNVTNSLDNTEQYPDALQCLKWALRGYDS